MLLLERDKYVHWCRFEKVTIFVQDIFWTHPDSIKLVSFNIIILMDNMYKTNKYRMSLLEVVGITSIGLTFFVAFCLLAAEKENNFVWAFDKLKWLYFRVDAYPRVVVCDKDIALINAIRIVFSEACNLLYQFHIDKNVKAKSKMLVHPR